MSTIKKGLPRRKGKVTSAAESKAVREHLEWLENGGKDWEVDFSDAPIAKWFAERVKLARQAALNDGRRTRRSKPPGKRRRLAKP